MSLQKMRAHTTSSFHLARPDGPVYEVQILYDDQSKYGQPYDQVVGKLLNKLLCFH